MTLREPIKLLRHRPEDALDFDVIYRSCSDWAVLEAEQISAQRSTDELTYGTAIPHHNRPREYRNYGDVYEYPLNTKPPTPANVICFPGN